VLIVGYLLEVGLRLAISWGRDGPTNFADEAGYLINARVLSGGEPGNLGTANFYSGGYSLLLLPAQWLGGDPLSEYRYVLATNALISSLVFPLAYALLTRVFRVPTRMALAAAFLAALYPPLVLTTQFAWAESLLPVLVLAAAVGLAATVAAPARRQAAGWAVACGCCAGSLYTVHPRTAPLVAILLGLLLGLALLRRDLIASAALGVTAAAAVIGAGERLNHWLGSRSWHHAGDTGAVRQVLDNARNPDSLPNVLALGLGQFWYLFIATFGLVVLGVVQGTSALSAPLALRDGRLSAAASRDSAGAPAVALFLLAGMIGLLAVVGLFLLPPTRPDHIVYGRYIEILAPALLALGLVRLWTTSLRRLAVELVVGVVAAAAAVLTLPSYAGGLVLRSPVNWYTVLALPPFAQGRDHLRLVAGTLVAVAGATVLLVVGRRSRAVAAVGLAVVLIGSSVALRLVLIEAGDRWNYATQSTPLATVDALDSAAEVGYDTAAYIAGGLYGYQWQLDRTHFVLFDSRHDPIPQTEWVIAGTDWPQAREAGARRVWVHPAFGQAVWRLP
jgi:hypothetical protein